MPDDEGSIVVPAYKNGYSLLYGSPQCFQLLKLFATIYERLIKARQLITSQCPKHANEKFDMFVGVVLLTLGQQERKIEQSAFEDLVRVLLGKDAYLLFVFDRLISATLKSMTQFHQVEES